MGRLVPTCVWQASDPLVIALYERFGEPLDAYVNGAQVWLRDDGPGGITLEWRLHPVAGFKRPPDTGTYDLFGLVAQALARDREPPAPLDELWEGMECFPAYGDEAEPAPLAAAALDALGLPPDATGLVDHDPIGDAYERAGGMFSVIGALFDQLRA
jgi:hypothetical protein